MRARHVNGARTPGPGAPPAGGSRVGSPADPTRRQAAASPAAAEGVFPIDTADYERKLTAYEAELTELLGA